MNGATTRQKALLGILAAVLVIALWQTLWPSGDDADGSDAPPAVSDPESADEAPARPRLPGSRSRGRKGEPVDQVVNLRLSDLELGARDYAPGRDPWRFRVPPPPPPTPEPLPPQPSAEELARQRAVQDELRRQAEERARLQAIEDARPKPPPFPYKYLGYFGPPSSRLAAFSDGTNRVIAREGQVIEGKFVVAQIGYESVDIQFVGFPEVQAQRVPVGR